MATITKPNTLVTGATITAAEHNDNYDTIYNDYNGNITNVNLSATAGIVDTKLNQITTAAKVHGSSLVGLASINTSTAGIIPSVSVETGTTAGKIVAMGAGNKLPAVDGSLLTYLVRAQGASYKLDSGSIGSFAATSTRNANFSFTYSAAPVVITTYESTTTAGTGTISVMVRATTGCLLANNTTGEVTGHWIAIGVPA